MNNLDRPQVCAPGLGDDRAFSRDSIERTLLDVAVRAVRRQSCGGLDRVPVLGRHGALSGLIRRGALIGDAWADALPPSAADLVDADAVADWIVDRYPAGTYPGVVLGSPHGGAVHLAAALGGPWLPTGFTVHVHWPEGAAGDWPNALKSGKAVAEQILAANPTVTVRQVHDPIRRGTLAGSTLTLHVRWRRLPRAYRDFLRSRLEPEGAALLLRDIRTWPVLPVRPGFSFQIGSPASGWHHRDHHTGNPSFAKLLRRMDGGTWTPVDRDLPHRFTEFAAEVGLETDLREAVPCHRVLYPSAESLSACVGDLYRGWLRSAGRGGDRCVVETERLLDPWLVMQAGLVPYWLEAASAQAVGAAETWIAGHQQFDFVDVLPQPPGTVCDAHATPAQWRVPSWFAARSGRVDREALRRYPMLPLATSHATAALRNHPVPSEPPVRLSMTEALAGLRRTGDALGVLVV